MEGAPEGRPASGLALPCPRAGRKEGRGRAGGLPPPASETGHLGCGAAGPCRAGSVHARRCLCSRGCVSRRGSAGATATPGAGRRGGSFVFHGGTTPLSPGTTHSSVPHSRPHGGFCRTGVRCEVAGLAGGEGEWVEAGTEIFARGCLGAGAAGTRVLARPGRSRLLTLERSLLFLHFSCSEDCLLDFL